jgi:hypothetical protein
VVFAGFVGVRAGGSGAGADCAPSTWPASGGATVAAAGAERGRESVAEAATQLAGLAAALAPIGGGQLGALCLGGGVVEAVERERLFVASVQRWP